MLNNALDMQEQSVAPVAGQQVVVGKDGSVTLKTVGEATPADNYKAAKALRDELVEQRDDVSASRGRLAEAAREGNRTATDINGLESRVKLMDEQLLDLQKQIAVANAKVAQAAAQPFAVIPAPPRPPSPPDMEDILAGGAMFSFALLFPFVIAYSRRIWRRSAKVTVTLPPEVATRMQAMEEAIESVAVEVERIGEGQRFMTQALSAGSAEAVPIRARELMHAEQHR